MRAFPYFVNNLAPGMRAFWIRYSDRVRIDEFMRDDLVRLRPKTLSRRLLPILRCPAPSCSIPKESC